ncbi:hypothetical protein V8F20_012200 [Naviculisporaceae sp. PSN 640]
MVLACTHFSGRKVAVVFLMRSRYVATGRSRNKRRCSRLAITGRFQSITHEVDQMRRDMHLNGSFMPLSPIAVLGKLALRVTMLPDVDLTCLLQHLKSHLPFTSNAALSHSSTLVKPIYTRMHVNRLRAQSFLGFMAHIFLTVTKRFRTQSIERALLLHGAPLGISSVLCTCTVQTSGSCIQISVSWSNSILFERYLIGTN